MRNRRFRRPQDGFLSDYSQTSWGVWGNIWELIESALNAGKLTTALRFTATSNKHRVESDVTAATKPDGSVVVFGKNKDAEIVVFKLTSRADWTSTDSLLYAASWDAPIVSSAAPNGAGIFVGNPISYAHRDSNDIFAVVTTSKGHVVRISENGTLSNLTVQSTSSESEKPAGYADPAVVQDANNPYIYAANQRGDIVELRYSKATPNANVRLEKVAIPDQNRDTMVFQSINAWDLSVDGERYIYATDGRLTFCSADSATTFYGAARGMTLWTARTETIRSMVA